MDSRAKVSWLNASSCHGSQVVTGVVCSSLTFASFTSSLSLHAHLFPPWVDRFPYVIVHPSLPNKLIFTLSPITLEAHTLRLALHVYTGHSSSSRRNPRFRSCPSGLRPAAEPVSCIRTPSTPTSTLRRRCWLYDLGNKRRFRWSWENYRPALPGPRWTSEAGLSPVEQRHHWCCRWCAPCCLPHRDSLLLYPLQQLNPVL